MQANYLNERREENALRHNNIK